MTKPRTPNAVKYHDPRPAYIRSLVIAIGKPVTALAKESGITESSLYRYMHPDTPVAQLASYPAQVILELLAGRKAQKKKVSNI